MRSFYMDLPEELADAGGSTAPASSQVFWRIMLPLSGPGVAVLAVLVFFQTWNIFVLPLCTCRVQRTRCSPRASTCSRAADVGVRTSWPRGV